MAFINNQGRVGSIGFIPPIISWLLPVQVVKFDVATEVPVRVNGRCVPCDPGEAGEILGQIVAGDPSREFPGYTRSDATEKKVCGQL